MRWNSTVTPELHNVVQKTEGNGFVWSKESEEHWNIS
jgi:hypothetical protein